MKHRVKITKLIHCGCDAEGEIEAEMSDSTRLFIYYQGSDKQAKNKFVVGEYVDLKLVGSLCRAKSSNEPSKQFSFPRNNCCFIATGQLAKISDLNDDYPFELESEFPIRFDIEFGEEPDKIGSWIQLEGELWVDNWW